MHTSRMPACPGRHHRAGRGRRTGWRRCVGDARACAFSVRCMQGGAV